MVHPGRIAWACGLVLALVVSRAATAGAQVDQPANPRLIPRGRRWWCYSADLPSGLRGERCVRQRDACNHAPDAVAPVLCTQETRAYCLTYTARDYSTGRPVEGSFCVQQSHACEAQRERLYSTVGRDPLVSACTEAR